MNEVGGCALQTGPYPPGLSRHVAYGTSTTDSLALHLQISLDGPASSGRVDTSRRCPGLLPALPGVPRIGLPPASAGRCDGLLVESFHLHMVKVAPRGERSARRTRAARRQDVAVQ